MWLAFSFHLAGIVATLTATGLTSLFTATVFMGLGNGMVEAVCNPLVATDAIRTMSLLPAILIVLYGGLFFVRRSKAAEQPV